MSRKHPGSKHYAALDPRRWALLRLRVFERDAWRCRKCGRAGRLECDHIVPMHRGGAEHDMANLQSLCRPCHIEKTTSENNPPNPDRDAWKIHIRDLFGQGGVSS